MRILASHENYLHENNYQEARDYLEDLNSNMFLDDIEARIYIMYRGNEPISFAIYSKIDKTKEWVLELIYTHSDYTKLGIASALLRVSSAELKNSCDAKLISSTVNKKNYPSISLHNSFSKVDGVKIASEDIGNRIKFHFDVKNLNNLRSSEQVEEMLF
jgi:GNAT superfamily N-acetyltransferase